MTILNNPRAKYGAEAYKNLVGGLPTPFPRIMGPNALLYLKEFIESGMNVSMIDRFEQKLAGMLGVKHCIAAPGCTAALALLGEGLRFDPGDEVIISPITDYGTITGIIKSNYIPVFADTNRGDININAKTIEARITDRTRAIICVHKTGLMCDMDPIMDLAQKHRLLVIEDACQAFGSTYKGRLAGTIGHFGAFSFDAEKTVGSDIGGALVTNDDERADYCRFIGQSRGAVEAPGYGRQHTEPGHGYRMPHCTAAVTMAQLEISHENVDQRDRMMRLLIGLLKEIPGITPLTIPSYQENTPRGWPASASMLHSSIVRSNNSARKWPRRVFRASA